MPKARRITQVEAIRKMCAASHSMHLETARLIESLSKEPRYAASASPSRKSGRSRRSQKR